MLEAYDALLLVSFGGPESREDVLPFLEHVLRGRNVPRERLLEVAEHYYCFGGVSPINGQNRALLAALDAELTRHGPTLKTYWGNRNWHPFLTDTLRQMARDGVRRTLALATSAYSSYSSCRQYLEDIAQARAAVGAGAPVVDKIRPFFNHPGWIETLVDRVRDAISQVPPSRRGTCQMVFTAHSIPLAMADRCDYVGQLGEVFQLVTEQLAEMPAAMVYQSRSGPPSQPWLEPDIRDHLEQMAASGAVTDVVVVPYGFVSDHMEVVYDLDCEARQLCETLNLRMTRALTPGTHPRFVSMLRELILERVAGAPRRASGKLGPRPDHCPDGCCLKA